MSDVGALALVKFEYTDKSGWKVRPGLITGEYLNDYQVTFITKEVNKYSHEDTSVIIDNDDLSAGRLMKKSRRYPRIFIPKSCKRHFHQIYCVIKRLQDENTAAHLMPFIFGKSDACRI